jgi:hypothetical protein
MICLTYNVLLGLCYWNWDFLGNSSKESISGCTSFAKHEVLNPQQEVIIDYSIYYSCFTQVRSTFNILMYVHNFITHCIVDGNF